MAGRLAALLSFRGVLAFWIVYGVAHAALRLGMTRTLTIDDARANELTQTLAFGYQLRQPPLYEWVLWCVQQVLGAGIESHLAVRYSLIGLLGLATFGAVKAAVKDDRWAAVASLSLAFAYPVAWTFHEWATQTIVLSIACMLTMQAVIRWFEAPGLRAAVFLGAALALGALSKFSYPLFLGGLVLAALSMAETRARLADARLLLAIAIAGLALASYALWVLQVRGDVVADLSSHLVANEWSHVRRAGYGLWRLAVSIPTFLLPWILIVALLAPAAFVRPPADAPASSLGERLSLRTMLFAAALAAIGIVALGATNIAARYMHPILIVAPVFVFARVARLAPGEARLRQFAAFALIVAMFVLAFRFAAATDNPVTRALDRRLLLPYAELAEALKAQGVVGGTVISPSVREAGNLRAFIPELRVAAHDSLRVQRPPWRAGDDRSCALVWAEGQESAARRMAPFDEAAVRRIDVLPKPGILAARPAAWFMVRLDPTSPACR
ncbi:MAG: glycosyltransferase family 39 protein [Bradyrhizobiaceae bacterium]|nr:glycosyltransferase family 39 protein [Bradyrhizobiaceae bacterium]